MKHLECIHYTQESIWPTCEGPWPHMSCDRDFWQNVSTKTFFNFRSKFKPLWYRQYHSYMTITFQGWVAYFQARILFCYITTVLVLPSIIFVICNQCKTLSPFCWQIKNNNFSLNIRKACRPVFFIKWQDCTLILQNNGTLTSSVSIFSRFPYFLLCNIWLNSSIEGLISQNLQNNWM